MNTKGRTDWFWILFVLALFAGFIVVNGVALMSDKYSSNLLWLFDKPKQLLMLVLFYPIIEEISFRGVLQGLFLQYSPLRARYLGVTPANILVSIVFSITHLVYHDYIWALLVFPPSLVFGYFRDYTGKPYASIWLHMFYNLIFLSVIEA